MIPVYPNPEADLETDLQYVRGTGTTRKGLLLHGYNHRRYYACHLTQKVNLGLLAQTTCIIMNQRRYRGETSAVRHKHT